MSNKIQVNRGIEANLPILDIGEPAITTDTKKPFIGTGSGNMELATKAQLNDLAGINNYSSHTTYNDKGQMIQVDDYNQGVLVFREKYTYDSITGYITSVTSIYADKTVTETIIYNGDKIATTTKTVSNVGL